MQENTFQTPLFHEQIENNLASYKIEILLPFSQNRIIGYHPEKNRSGAKTRKKK
jgi:hypothetical protein